MKFRVIRHHFPEIDSTNTWAKKHIASFDRQAITIVTADKQTHGRGRLGRTWHSPTGNVCVSFCFFWKGQNILNIPQLMALNIVELLESLGIKGAIKWPNDVLVDKRKIGGILCETVEYEGQKGVIVGVGLNVCLTKKELMAIDQPSCSFESLGVDITSSEVLERLTELFLVSLDRLKDSKELFFLDRYKSKIIHRKGDSLKGGIYEGIDNEGFLMLQKGPDQTIRIASVIDE